MSIGMKNLGDGICRYLDGRYEPYPIIHMDAPPGGGAHAMICKRCDSIIMLIPHVRKTCCLKCGQYHILSGKF